MHIDLTLTCAKEKRGMAPSEINGIGRFYLLMEVRGFHGKV
jgi:hypothetical protein